MMCPLVDWSIATRRFNDHQCKSEIHKTSLLTMQIFISVMENEIKPISQIQSEAVEKQVSKNREKLSSIVKTILLCGRQNIPLRGHRDDSSDYDAKNCGNFQAMLDFRVDSGDEVLKQHFENAPRNATYRSKTIQNDLISCCGEIITDQILSDIKDAKFYSILADEVKKIAQTKSKCQLY